MAIQELLREIGFNDKEIRVYLALLKGGRMTPASLAKICKINRPTVYNISKSLLSKGVIAEDLGGKTLHLAPLPPESLHQVIERPKRELAEKEEVVEKTIRELGLLNAEKRYQIPKIRFVEEDDVETFLYENLDKWAQALKESDFTWWGFQDHSLIEHYEKWVLWSWKQKSLSDPRMKLRLFSNASDVEQRVKRKVSRAERDIRFISGLNFTSSVWVAGDYLVMAVTRQRPFHIVEIHDATLAQNMREVFKKLWSLNEAKQ